MSDQQGHQIFISYKYGDRGVQVLKSSNLIDESTQKTYSTPRDYVNVLEKYIEKYSPHYYKGEEEGESLKGKNEDWIWDHLKALIFDTSITIVLISPNMKNKLEPEEEQWIPNEIRYSLEHKTKTNDNGTEEKSAPNAMLAIVLPDTNGKYDYYFEYKKCCNTGCRLNKTNFLFNILRNNIFNKKEPKCYICDKKDKIYNGIDHSYISFYRWCDIDNEDFIEKAIQNAFNIKSRKDDYDISLKFVPKDEL